jgi:16S rRNA processing protein RimM
VSAKQPKWVTLGRVSGVFGVKGWLKVQSYTEPHGNIVEFDAWTLRLNGVDRVFELEAGQSHGSGVIAKLRGIDDRDVAYGLAGAEIVVPREQLPAVEEGEFYWTDLEGLEVRTPAGSTLGRVAYLMATGGNDVMVLDGSPERLIPFILGSVVKSVDLAAGVIVVDWTPDF